MTTDSPIERARMDVDIACVGFGPAMGGFLSTLTKKLVNEDGTPAVESAAMPGMPPQVMCYERADDIGFGVSGVVTRARAIRGSYPELDEAGIPMATPVEAEKVLYLLDPTGASRRPALMKAADAAIKALKWALPVEHDALDLPWTPPFLHKKPGMVLSMGQFMQWVGAQVQATGAVQVWPGTPVSEALFEDGKVVGVRLLDQGVDKAGTPTDGFMPGMDIRAALTVIGDGPVGPIGAQLDERLGLPEGHRARDWAIGMKFVIDLPAGTPLKPGTVLHTFGYPEPEIFGFLYVHPDNVASLGIFVPTWFDSPVRTAYRYLQHWMLHPYLWRYLDGGKLRSWGAKTLGESGLHGEPRLAGDGFARIGEGSGTTNVLTGSGVDEAWASGVQLAEGVLELLKAAKPFTKENLEAAYVSRRRASWLETEGRVAEKSRNGFQKGFIPGLIGMAVTGLTGGVLSPGGEPVQPYKRIPTLEEYYKGRIPADEIEAIRRDCAAKGTPLHGALMERAGWPAIPYDGALLISHQDSLLLGGKVQAPPGYADHVVFTHPEVCTTCQERICIEGCSGQAIAPGEAGGVPAFDREKCVHCGACLWNCSKARPGDEERMIIAFKAGAGGLHSAEN
ncbi:MAG: 4Fe-4S ferredoxin [Chthoniobacteraceae bacterium]